MCKQLYLDKIESLIYIFSKLYIKIKRIASKPTTSLMAPSNLRTLRTVRMLRSLQNHQLGGIHKLRCQNEVGRQVVLEMSTTYKFSLISLKEFLHKCQQGVGRWSIRGKILSTQFMNTPLRNPCFQRTFFSGLNGAIIYTSIESKDVS